MKDISCATIGSSNPGLDAAASSVVPNATASKHLSAGPWAKKKVKRGAELGCSGTRLSQYPGLSL